MSFVRPLVSPDGKLPQPMRAGIGMLANFAVTQHAADAVLIVTAAMIAGGQICATTTLTADRIFTTDTAANILALFPQMEIGDAYSFVVSNSQTAAFEVILAPGSGITLKGAGNVAAQASKTVTLVKTGVATMDMF